MKRFAALYQRLDASNRTSDKVAALVDYFRSAPPEDAAWAVALLVGDRPKRVVDIRDLLRTVLEDARLPQWMLEECYDAVGDFAETAALVLPDPVHASAPLGLAETVEALVSMRKMDPSAVAHQLRSAWDRLESSDERMVFFKLIGGAFRVGASKGLVLRALAEVAGVEVPVVAARLSGTFIPSARAFRALVDPEEHAERDPSRPYPFFLATPLESPAELGDASDFLFEWKWDGIRAQLVRRAGETWLWSRGEEIVTHSFPEVAQAASRLPEGTVLDGEILAFRDDVMPFANLQRRIHTKAPSRKLLGMVPVVLLCFDLLEEGGADLRALPIEERRARLAARRARARTPALRPSPLVAGSWSELEGLWRSSRERKVEGLMIKRRGSPYRTGRPRGDWWKWKTAPLSVDCVLFYAQRGSGKRASLYTDYTFAVWHEGVLVPFAKAYSGLTDAEILTVDKWVREHTTDRFGPVRQVEPSVVMELGFEGIQRSARHKSGLAVRFPRILRLRADKRADQADTLDSLLALADLYAAAPLDEDRPAMVQLDLFTNEKSSGGEAAGGRLLLGRAPKALVHKS